jgi:hypothetical protein
MRCNVKLLRGVLFATLLSFCVPVVGQVFNSLSPNAGSVGGGTLVTFMGSGE